MRRELLVVEDSDDDYDAFVRTCRTVGFDGSLRRFADAEDALGYLKGLHELGHGHVQWPTLILLDLNLPGMDGRDFLDLMKADDALRQLPVVVFTTSSSEGDVAYCYKHFVNAYHVKPMNIAQFESDVSALLDYWFTRAQSPILE